MKKSKIVELVVLALGALISAVRYAVKFVGYISKLRETSLAMA